MCETTEPTIDRHLEEKDNSIIILKAFIAIFFVMSFSGGPGWLVTACYIFSIPALLMSMGYFFKAKYLQEEKRYIKQKIKNIYCPFWGWSILFLLLHNFFAWLGLVPSSSSYDWHGFVQRIWSVTFNMSGYDEYICYVYWVFRTLFISSIAFLVLYKVIGKLTKWTQTSVITGMILVLTLFLTIWSILGDLEITGVSQGGRAELIGTFFFGVGVMYRHYEKYLRMKWLVALVSLALWIGFVMLSDTSITCLTTLSDSTPFLLPAVASFVAMHAVSKELAMKGKVISKGLIYIGERVFIIIAFFLLSFKVVSIFESLIEDHSWSYVAMVPILRHTQEMSIYFVLYLVLGVALPLLSIVLWKWLDKKYNLTWFNCIKYTITGFILAIRYIGKFFAYIGKSIWKSIVGFFKDMKGFVNASNPKDE